MNRKSAQHKQEIGKKGEAAAVYYLRSIGYSILKRNHRIGRSEIDIIALDGDDHVFVEVKTRSGNPNIWPESDMRPNQWKSLQRAAELYCNEVNDILGVRFDVVAVQFTENRKIIKHHKDLILPMETID